MKKQIGNWLAAAVMGLAPLCGASAQASAETPILEFKTILYENVGDQNAFHFYIGAKEDTYIDIDFGYGLTEVEVTQANFNGDSNSMDATVVTGTVGPEGIVRIYGDASLIDYLDLEGVYITDINLSKLTELEILNLSYNELKGLDLSNFPKLQALYVDANPFDVTPFVLGPNKPMLTILSMSMCGPVASSFNLSDYPSLVSFQAYSTPSITQLDPTGCPELLQLTAEGASISSIDVSKNSKLLILNVAGTRVNSLDLSKNPYLTELYAGHNGSVNTAYQFTHVDVTHNPELVRLFVEGNALKSIDLSKNPKLQSFYATNNYLESLNLDANPALYELHIRNNCLTFATLPADRETFSDYVYDQRPLPVEKCYAVDSELDFSATMLRPGSVTDAALYIVNRGENNGSMLEDTYYSWDRSTGILTLKEIPEGTDSCYVAFMNSELPDAVLTTTRFMIKSKSQMGEPTGIVSIQFSTAVKEQSLSVGIDGATETAPVEFFVDFGDGDLLPFSATTTGLPGEPNVKGSRAGTRTTIYMPEGKTLTALGVDGQRILSINLDEAIQLRELSLTNCTLSNISLSWNRCLQSLNLSGNRLSTIDLEGYNGNFGKHVLRSLDLSNNRLTEINIDSNQSWLTLDLSNNQLESLPILKATNLRELNCSGNLLTTIDLRDSESLEVLDASNNQMVEFPLPDYVPLKKLDLRGNVFTFSALPSPDCAAEFIYAPQQEVLIPEKAPVASLASYLSDADGNATVYTWYMAEDNSPVAPGNIREKDGRFFFDNPELGKVYCTMSNPGFPQFEGANILRTTVVETAPMPTHVFASFTPAEDGPLSLILTGASNGTTVYVDWTGKGDMDQLILGTSYKSFEGMGQANETAKCYSYDTDDNVTVFSLMGNLKDLDASSMKSLIHFTAGTGLEDENIKLPYLSTGLQELCLGGNIITDLSSIIKRFPALIYILADNCPITSVDLSSNPQLTVALLPDCELEEITLDNPNLWFINLSGNNFKSISFEGAPALSQLFMWSNLLESIDVSKNTRLHEVRLDQNCFTFQTLPRLDNVEHYSYSNQAPVEPIIDGATVDLSSQSAVDGVSTLYRWFIDSPYLDEDGNLMGEELIEGEEYTINNGVTTFLNSFGNIMCVMTNSLFPKLYLLTPFINVTVSGIEDVSAEAADVTVTGRDGSIVVNAPATCAVNVFTVSGQLVGSATGSCTFSGLENGVYIVKAGEKAVKLALH